jgi:hypothetical protein
MSDIISDGGMDPRTAYEEERRQIKWDSPPPSTTPERYIDASYATKPNGKRGRQPTYHAKIGTHGSTTIIIKRARSFIPGQRVQYAELHALRGASLSCTPQWQGGVVRRVDRDMLFIDRM